MPLMNADKKKNIIRCFILVAALALLAAGAVSGGYQDVMNKAVFVCFECIGIG